MQLVESADGLAEKTCSLMGVKCFTFEPVKHVSIKNTYEIPCVKTKIGVRSLYHVSSIHTIL